MQQDAGLNPPSGVLFVSLVNIARVRKDVPPLLIDTDLVAVVQDAYDEDRSPTATAAALTGHRLESSWTRAGEVTGSAPSVVDFLDGILTSRDHHALVMDPEFTRVGVVVYLGDRHATVRVVLTDGTRPEHHPMN